MQMQGFSIHLKGGMRLHIGCADMNHWGVEKKKNTATCGQQVRPDSWHGALVSPTIGPVKLLRSRPEMSLWLKFMDLNCDTLTVVFWLGIFHIFCIFAWPQSMLQNDFKKFLLACVQRAVVEQNRQ